MIKRREYIKGKGDMVGNHLRVLSQTESYNHVHQSLFQSDLPNMTWHEVQAKLLEVQKEQQMCIHKKDLTQLGRNSFIPFVTQSKVLLTLRTP